jgi:hypothetical protein
MRTTRAMCVRRIERLLGGNFTEWLDPYDRRTLEGMTILQLLVVERLMIRKLDSVAVKHARRLAAVTPAAEPIPYPVSSRTASRRLRRTGVRRSTSRPAR